VFVALGTQYERRMAILSSVTYPALLYFSILPYKRYDLRNKVSVFGFSLQIWSETFLILRRTERGTIKNVYCSSSKYLSFLLDFNET
jgi:hypothetical protein